MSSTDGMAWWTIAIRDDVPNVAYVYRSECLVYGIARVVYRTRATSAVEAMHLWGMAQYPPVEFTCTDVQIRTIAGIEKHMISYTRPMVQRETTRGAWSRLSRAWAWFWLEVRLRLVGGRG